MNIDGSNFNHLLSQIGSGGLRSSSASKSSALLANAAPRIADAESGQSISETFANEIARRAMAYTDASGQPKDTSSLAAGLSDAVDYLRENYGDDVATAAEAMIMGGTASGITEKNLGDSLTNVLRMVDRNFGFAAGDAAIARFNGGLNSAINEYFDNGLDEQFLALEPGQSLSQSMVMGDLNARVLARTSTAADNAPSGAEQLLDALKDDLTESLDESLEGLTPEALTPAALAKQQLADLQSELTASGTNASLADAPRARTAQALNGYAAASGLYAPAAPQMLSMSV